MIESLSENYIIYYLLCPGWKKTISHEIYAFLVDEKQEPTSQKEMKLQCPENMAYKSRSNRVTWTDS
jgi:hypothetical protein